MCARASGIDVHVVCRAFDAYCGIRGNARFRYSLYMYAILYNMRVRVRVYKTGVKFPHPKKGLL